MEKTTTTECDYTKWQHLGNRDNRQPKSEFILTPKNACALNLVPMPLSNCLWLTRFRKSAVKLETEHIYPESVTSSKLGEVLFIPLP